MKDFRAFRFDPRLCRTQLDELKTHLDNHSRLNERSDVLPFFRKREHLAAFIGSYFPYISDFDRLAFEYDIFGDFKADLVIGDSKSGWYCFIEFEDASSTSIFEQKGGRATRAWSTRFEHGFSQITDWFWKLADMEGTREFISRFGNEYTGYEGMLIIGRTLDLAQKERDRLRWRRDRVLADSKHIHCVTFDELYDHLDARLRSYEAAFLADEDIE